MADATSYKDGDEVRSGALYRRIFPHRDFFKDGRPTSLNFLPDRGEPSLSLYRAAEVSPSDVLTGHDGFGLLEIDAEVLWAIGCRVIYEGSIDKGHVGAVGFTKRDAQPRRDAGTASRVLQPPTIPF